MSFLDQKPFTVTKDTLAAFKRLHKAFNCSLCGHVFTESDVARWIYANGTPGARTGNFFVCSNCDGENSEVIERASASLKEAIRLAKQWGIYGPDWQRQ
jgi:rubredoxin